MRKNHLLKKAIKQLSETEQKLIGLLTDENTSKAAVMNFLEDYDIETEKASDTFMINGLLDRFGLSEKDNAKIPRIRGVKEFYRFHNINAMKALPKGSLIFDVDLYLRTLYPDAIRPFISGNVIDENALSSCLGRRYIKKYKASSTEKKGIGQSFYIPDGKYLADLLYVRLFFSIIYKKKTFNYAYYVYDVLRYTPDQRPSAAVYGFIVRKTVRHFLGECFRWIFK